MNLAWRLARPLLFALDPEAAHRLAIRALASGLVSRAPPPDPMLRQRLLGLDFPSPIGMAAGFDKNGEVPDALLTLGFGFVEVGTVTPRPQPGNPSPRLFRLPEHRAIINRLGFNGEGHDVVHARLSARSRRGIVGVNIGANRDSPDRVADYVAGIGRFADVADYLAINISSPNTPGLRDLHAADDLTALLRAVVGARDAQSRRVPLLLKISPDLDDIALTTTAEIAVAGGVEGMIVSNTTTARDAVTGHRNAGEAGGLSGPPLFARSTAMLAKVRKLAGRRLVLVGVGGVDSPATVSAKILAGADLVQLYTGMIFRGPGLAREIVAGLPALLRHRGFTTVAEAVGAESDRFAAGSA